MVVVKPSQVVRAAIQAPMPKKTMITPGKANSASSKKKPRRNQNNSALNQSIGNPFNRSRSVLAMRKCQPFWNAHICYKKKTKKTCTPILFMKTSVHMNILHIKFRLFLCRWKNRFAVWHYCYIVYPRFMAACWLRQPLPSTHQQSAQAPAQ